MQRKQHSPALTNDKSARNLRALHISVIILSSIVFAGSALFSNIWFDEAYTVGAVSRSMTDMIRYLTYDVHPHLYYIALKLYSYIFGSSIIALRMFSAVFGVACVALGYTHIRKDFGDKVGFWFSFVMLFTFSTLVYAAQIRMYTLAIFLITLTAVYAYRRLSDDSRRNRVLYLVFSILSAYTHYFAFFIIAMINAFTLVRAIKNSEKAKSLKRWFADAAIQFGGYAPGIAVFIFQITLGGADWITVDYPTVIYDTLGYPFFAAPLSDNIDANGIWYDVVGIAMFIAAAELFTKLRFGYKLDKEKYKAPFFSALLCIAVLAFTLGVSFFRAIYYIRYSVCFAGFASFCAAWLISNIKRKYIKAFIAVLLVAVFLCSAVPMWQNHFSENNRPFTEQIDIREGDVVIMDNFHAFVCTIEFPETEIIYNNLWGWPIDKTYPLFGKKVTISRDISEYDHLDCRIWICGDETIKYFDSRTDVEMIEEKWVHTDYYDYSFYFRLYEKK